MKNKLRKWFSLEEFLALQINNTLWTDIKYGKCNKWQWGLN